MVGLCDQAMLDVIKAGVELEFAVEAGLDRCHVFGEGVPVQVSVAAQACIFWDKRRQAQDLVGALLHDKLLGLDADLCMPARFQVVRLVEEDV